ncbi:MAG: YbaK/EbsC family protein [Anaerolineales bacterium]
MRITALFGNTLREDPPEARSAAHRFLVRGAFVRPIAPGQFAWLPLGARVRARLAAWLEAHLPEAQPLALPPGFNHPATLFAAEIHTYRHLPALLYAWQEVQHAPAGLLRARHHRTLHAWHLAPQEASETPFPALLGDLWQICGLQVISAEDAAAGRAFLYPHPAGEDRLRRCPACGCTATRQAARRAKTACPAAAPAPLEPVHTPGTKTIADLAALLNIPTAQTAKAVFLSGARPDGSHQLVFAMLRGDMDLNPEKLARLSGLHDLRPAEEAEIRAIGAEPGFASPVGLPEDADCLVAVDDLIPHSANLVAGANRPDTHLRNVNYGRDFTAALIGDLAEARPGDPCPQCGQPLEGENAVLLARLVPAGEAAPPYADAGGMQHRAVLTALHLDADAVLACAVESHHDDYGIQWPPALAPFDVHLLTLPGKKDDGSTLHTAQQLYEALRGAGFSVLLDERSESPGVKFNDADLIGIPWRVTVSARALATGGVEIKQRAAAGREIQPIDAVLAYLQENGAAQTKTIRMM